METIRTLSSSEAGYAVRVLATTGGLETWVRPAQGRWVVIHEVQAGPVMRRGTGTDVYELGFRVARMLRR